MKTRPWTFITDHGRILVYLTKHKQATARQIAAEANLSERAVQKVIHDLVQEGYVIPERHGRGNTYDIRPELPMRHFLEAMGCEFNQ